MAREITHPAQGAANNTVLELMSTFDPGELVARGMVQGHSSFRKFGFNPLVGTTESIIATTTGVVLPWTPLVAQEVEVVSDDARDGVGGDGALTVTVQGLDANWNEQEVTVTLNGQTPVATTGLTWIRIHCAFVASTGTYRGSNLGVITVIETESPAETIRTLPIGHGQCGNSHYSVAAGKAVLVKNYNIQIGTGKTATVHLRFAANGNDVTAPYSGGQRVLLELEGVLTGQSGNFGTPFFIPPYSDIWATGEVTAQTGHIFFDYSGTLITL